MRVSGHQAGSTSSFKWAISNITDLGFWLDITLSISTSNVHGVVAIHLPVNLFSTVAIHRDGILYVTNSFQIFIFITESKEMSMLAPWCQNIHPSLVQPQPIWCNCYMSRPITSSFCNSLHMIKVCLNCDLPILTSQHVNPTGHKSWPIAKCTAIADIISIRADHSTSYKRLMTWNSC